MIQEASSQEPFITPSYEAKSEYGHYDRNRVGKYDENQKKPEDEEEVLVADVLREDTKEGLGLLS